MLGDYHMADQYMTLIDKVTAADVQRVIKQYLVKPNRTVGVLVPTGLLPHEAGGVAVGTVQHAAGFAPEGTSHGIGGNLKPAPSGIDSREALR
jgi:hypothetical protein